MTQTHKFRSYLATAMTVVALSTGVALTSVSTANAAPAAEQVAMADQVQTGSFTSSKYKIKGSWKILKENGQTILRFSDDFKTKNGPDLKLFLSLNAVEDLTGKTARNQAVRLSVLRSNRGTQDYVIPADVDLSKFKSVVIQCEAFSVLWGGANLHP